MRFFADIVAGLCAGTLLSSAVGAQVLPPLDVSALASRDRVLSREDTSAQFTPIQSQPSPQQRPPAADRRDSRAMGNAWPKTPEEIPKTLDNLLAHLATEGDPARASAIAGSIEKLWRLEGGDTVNLLIDRASTFAAGDDEHKALRLLDAAVDLAPDYAEAWIRRAYVHYVMDNTRAALGDLRRALALEPNHFRALDLLGKILSDLGESQAALKVYDQLLDIYPSIAGAQDAAQQLRKKVEGQGI